VEVSVQVDRDREWVRATPCASVLVAEVADAS
jgi:hypothetical protein